MYTFMIVIMVSIRMYTC